MWVPSDLCADLERQVQEMREQVEEMKAAAQFASGLKDERDEWRLLAEQAADKDPDPTWHRDYARLLKLYPIYK